MALHRPATADVRQTHRDVEAALSARRELGPDYDDAIAASLAERVEQLVEQRSGQRADEIARLADQEHQLLLDDRTSRTQRFALGIISLGAGIPITAIAAIQVHPGLLGVLVSWAGIVGVNIAFGWRQRTRH